MRDNRPTSKMEALDLRLLADVAAERQRPTCKMEKLDLLDLLRAESAAAKVTSAHAADVPSLEVITTPPEVRARWQLWLRIRASLALAIVLTLALIALIYFG